MPDDEAIDGLTDGAFRLWIAALCYTAKSGTNGFIQATRPKRLTPHFRPAHTTELVAANLWVAVDGGYQIRSYRKYNPAADEAKRLREYRARKKREAS